MDNYILAESTTLSNHIPMWLLRVIVGIGVVYSCNSFCNYGTLLGKPHLTEFTTPENEWIGGGEGLIVDWRRKRPIVVKVNDGTWAAKNGIEVGDEIWALGTTVWDKKTGMGYESWTSLEGLHKDYSEDFLRSNTEDRFMSFLRGIPGLMVDKNTRTKTRERSCFWGEFTKPPNPYSQVKLLHTEQPLHLRIRKRSGTFNAERKTIKRAIVRISTRLPSGLTNTFFIKPEERVADLKVKMALFYDKECPEKIKLMKDVRILGDNEVISSLNNMDNSQEGGYTIRLTLEFVPLTVIDKVFPEDEEGMPNYEPAIYTEKPNMRNHIAGMQQGLSVLEDFYRRLCILSEAAVEKRGLDCSKIENERECFRSLLRILDPQQMGTFQGVKYIHDFFTGRSRECQAMPWSISNTINNEKENRFRKDMWRRFGGLEKEMIMRSTLEVEELNKMINEVKFEFEHMINVMKIRILYNETQKSSRYAKQRVFDAENEEKWRELIADLGFVKIEDEARNPIYYGFPDKNRRSSWDSYRLLSEIIDIHIFSNVDNDSTITGVQTVLEKRYCQTGSYNTESEIYHMCKNTLLDVCRLCGEGRECKVQDAMERLIARCKLARG